MGCVAASAALVHWLRQPLIAMSNEPDASRPNAKTRTPLPYVDRIGLQLYTLRNQMSDDPVGTLKAVAEAGYKQVELMDINDEAVQLASIARDNGMSVHSAFLDFNVITEPERKGVASLDSVLEIAERIGLRHVVFGYIAKHQRDTADKCRQISDRANRAADQTRAAGMRMCYHNHSFEFAPFEKAGDATGDAKKHDAGKNAKPLTAFDIFMERFDPQKMEFELDVFWVKIGGHDPIAMMKRLAGRISQVHLKDLQKDTPVITDESKVPKDAFQEIGDGIIEMPAVMRLAHDIGVEQCHVEQDQSPDPLKSIRQSARHLYGHQS